MIEDLATDMLTNVRVKRSEVWSGCLLGSIAHAVFTCRAPLLQNEQSWFESTYSVQDTGSCRGAIVFAAEPDFFVGVASSFDSWPPLQSLSAEDVKAVVAENICDKFRGLPEHLYALRDEVLQYSLEQVHGVVVPVITAAFWASADDSLTASSTSWSSVIDDGGWIFEKQFMPPREALPRWQLDLGLDDDESKLVESLFERRTANEGRLLLSAAELTSLERSAKSRDALETALASLAEIGFHKG